MDRELLEDTLGWGFLLWLIGYVLGVALFMIVPSAAIGWIIMPIGAAITLWVLLRRIKRGPPGYYALIGVVWTLIAVVGDYLLIVKLFRPVDGYYKPDVYLYYALTLALPIAVGCWRAMQSGRAA